MDLLHGNAQGFGSPERDAFKSQEGALHSLHEGEEAASIRHREHMKLAHFNSFFAEQHAIRAPLREGTSLTEIITALIVGIRLLRDSRLWLKCNSALKLHIRLKQRTRAFRLECKRERNELLMEMLNFWMEAEKKRSAQVRKAIQDLATSSPEKYKQRSAQLTSIWTPDSVKGIVLWELYWLLRQQLLHNRAHYSQEKNRLFFARKKALSDLQNRKPGAREALTEANAALFILFLQTPCLKFSPKHFPFSTLVQLARFATSPDHGAVVPSCRIFTAFLVLPVCDSAAWLQKRRFMPYPLVPPLSADSGLPSSQAPANDADSEDGNEDTESLLRPPTSSTRRISTAVPMGRNTRVKCRSSSIASISGRRGKPRPSAETDGPSDSDSDDENTGPARRASTSHGPRRESIQQMNFSRRRSSSVVSIHGPKVVRGSGATQQGSAHPPDINLQTIGRVGTSHGTHLGSARLTQRPEASPCHKVNKLQMVLSGPAGPVTMSDSDEAEDEEEVPKQTRPSSSMSQRLGSARQTKRQVQRSSSILSIGAGKATGGGSDSDSDDEFGSSLKKLGETSSQLNNRGGSARGLSSLRCVTSAAKNRPTLLSPSGASAQNAQSPSAKSPIALTASARGAINPDTSLPTLGASRGCIISPDLGLKPRLPVQCATDELCLPMATIPILRTHTPKVHKQVF